MASSFVSIGSRGSAEQFNGTVQSMKWITDYTDSYFENLSLTGVSNLQQRHWHMYPVILTSSCRQGGRLFAQERNLSKHRDVTRSKGV